MKQQATEDTTIMHQCVKTQNRPFNFNPSRHLLSVLCMVGTLVCAFFGLAH